MARCRAGTAPGMFNAEVAGRLFVAESTMKTHVGHILEPPPRLSGSSSLGVVRRLPGPALRNVP
jgi:hypothetical protein